MKNFFLFLEGIPDSPHSLRPRRLYTAKPLCYEDFRDHSFETAAYLGLLDWGDGKTKSRLYAVRGQPLYLYVDMGWDHHSGYPVAGQI